MWSRAGSGNPPGEPPPDPATAQAPSGQQPHQPDTQAAPGAPHEPDTQAAPGAPHEPDFPTAEAQPAYAPSEAAAPSDQPYHQDPSATRPLEQPPYPADPGASRASDQPNDLRVPVKNKRRRLGDPVSIVLVLVIVVALAITGLVGGELIARHIAENKVAKAVECVVEDSANVSFGIMPPFLWQHINGDYTNISIKTAGHQLKQAKGMTAIIDIRDVDLHGDANSKGTIGALDATLTWTSEGISQTVQDTIPFGSFVSSSVTTNPGDGTIELKGTLDDVIIKPQVVDNGVSLQVVQFSGFGFRLPKESVQSVLDSFTSKLTKNYPLGIHADSVQVTQNGVVGHFSTRNATIPASESNPCFANL